MRVQSASANAEYITHLLRAGTINNDIVRISGDQITVRLQDYRQAASAVHAVERYAGPDIVDVWVIEPCDVVLQLASK